MSDLASLTNSPGRVYLGGKQYQIAELTHADLGALLQWARGQFPDPFDVVTEQISKGEYTVAQQQYLMKTALEMSVRKPTLGSPEIQAELRTPAGISQLLFLAIRKHDPSFTEAEAGKVFNAMTAGDLKRLEIITGADLVMGESPDPKAGMTDGATIPPDPNLST